MSAKNCDQYRNKIILAPMVRICTLPTRLMALRYGADLVYTEEIIDLRLLRCKRSYNEMLGTTEYIDQTDGTLIFSTCPEEKSKVILQMGTCCPERALKVALAMQDDVAGIDINMGCPKEFSIKGGMGAALLKQPDKIKDILTTLVNNVKVPVTCKIRVLSTTEETIELCRLIESCGVSAVAVHGRTVKERPQHANRTYFIRQVAERLTIPVIANGGSKHIKFFEDIAKFREETGCSSVMIARAAEWNTSIFSSVTPKEDVHQVIKKYLRLAIITNNPFSTTKYTIQMMLREIQESPLGKKFLATQLMEELCELWNETNFYQQKKLEWQAYKSSKRPLEDGDNSENPLLKKHKVESMVNVDDPSMTVIPDCVFVRNHYVNVEDLPKSVLIKWSRKHFRDPPAYFTEFLDKRFRAFVEINGQKFMTDVWEKNKKNAEQGAALACIKSLQISG